MPLHSNFVERMFSSGSITFKEEKGEFYSEGFIATTHPDRAASEDGKFVGDVIPKGTLQTIVDTINNRSHPEAGMASLRHDWIREQNPDLAPAGKATSAEIREMDGGHFGVWVETHHRKDHPAFEEIKRDVEQGYLPGYSIEYQTTDFEPVLIK